MCKPTDRRSGERHEPQYFLPEQLRSALIIPQRVWTAEGSWTQRKAYRLVHHDYHDHSRDNCAHLDLPKSLTKGGVMNQFPVQLHEILDTIEEDGHGDVISWQPHGRCFLVHKPKVFLKEIMPRYFKQRKFASFQRQLNLYGFQRLTTGSDKGGYYHELFLRNMPVLAQHIRRQRIKGTGVRPRSNPEEEPDFYSMPSCYAEKDISNPEPYYNFKAEKGGDPTEVTSSEEKSRPSSVAPVMEPMDEDDEQVQRSPSPAVMDHRTAKEKLCSSFQPEPTTSSNVVPFIVTSCSKSELHRPDESDEDDDDDGDLVIFEGKPFHYLNPLAPLKRPIVRSATPEVQEPEIEDGVVDKQLDAILGALVDEPVPNLDSMDELAFGTILANLVSQRT